MIAKFRAGELHSCLHHSSERPCSLGVDFNQGCDHKELWEGNGNRHSYSSDTVMGLGREAGIFVTNFFFRVGEDVCEDF